MMLILDGCGDDGDDDADGDDDDDRDDDDDVDHDDDGDDDDDGEDGDDDGDLTLLNAGGGLEEPPLSYKCGS